MFNFVPFCTIHFSVINFGEIVATLKSPTLHTDVFPTAALCPYAISIFRNLIVMRYTEQLTFQF